MKRVTVENLEVKIHYKVQNKILEKAKKVISGYAGGTIHPRKLRCGLFKVLDVSANDRIVIKDDILNLMTHSQYNTYIERR